MHADNCKWNALTSEPWKPYLQIKAVQDLSDKTYFVMTWQGLLRNKLCHLIKLDYIYIYVLISTAVYENTTMEQCVSL